jgi:hypothetical protein
LLYVASLRPPLFWSFFLVLMYPILTRPFSQKPSRSYISGPLNRDRVSGRARAVPGRLIGTDPPRPNIEGWGRDREWSPLINDVIPGRPRTVFAHVAELTYRRGDCSKARLQGSASRTGGCGPQDACNGRRRGKPRHKQGASLGESVIVLGGARWAYTMNSLRGGDFDPIDSHSLRSVDQLLKFLV